MTQAQQIFSELEKFREAIRELSREVNDERDFWSAYAEKANCLEAHCPLQLRDYAKDSILRIARNVASIRESVGSSQSSITHFGESYETLHA
jgi:hypothetical protein